MTGAIHIVSMADRGITRILSQADILSLEARFRRPVVFEHICLPPTPVLLSDLHFLEKHAARVPTNALAAVTNAAATLRSASFLILDDIAELYLPRRQVYGALSHDLSHDRRADLIAVRWQNYTAHHDRLPNTLVAGCDLPSGTRTRTIPELSAYLKKPIFRIATMGIFEKHTCGWDFQRRLRPLGAGDGAYVCEGSELANAIADWATMTPQALVPGRAVGPTRRLVHDLHHYCSQFVLKERVRPLLDQFSNFCVAGQRSSVRYIDKFLRRSGKPFVRVDSYSADQLASAKDKFDVILACGPVGAPPRDIPIAPIMYTGFEMSDALKAIAPYASFVSHKGQEHPLSNSNWHHDFDLDRAQDEPIDQTIEGLEISPTRRQENRRTVQAAALAKRAKAQKRDDDSPSCRRPMLDAVQQRPPNPSSND